MNTNFKAPKMGKGTDMPNLSEYLVAIPVTLDIERLLKLRPPTNIKPFKKDKLLYIIGIITSILANDRNGKITDGWVPINAITLKERVQNYRQYLDYLVKEVRVLAEDPFYTPAGTVFNTSQGPVVSEGESKRFKFTPKYQTLSVIVYLTDKVFVRALNRLEEEDREPVSMNGRERYPKLAEPFDSGLLEIELHAAEAYLRFELEYNLQHPEEFMTKRKKKSRKKVIRISPVQDKKKKKKRPVQEIIIESFNANLVNLYKFHAGRLKHFTIDPTVGRLHNPVSNMKKAMRHFLSYNGEKLVCLDLKNSQPFLSTALFREKFYLNLLNDINLNNHTTNTKDLMTHKYLHNNLQEKLTNTFSINPNKISFTGLSPLMLGEMEGSSVRYSKDVKKTKGSPVIDLSNADVLKYIQLVVEGTMYEHMEEIYKAELGLTYPSRREVKNQFFGVIFSDVYEDYKTSKTYRKFKEKFPTVTAFFEHLKSQGFNLLSCMLQSLEAEVFLNRICERVHSERPDMLLISVHDGLATTIGNEDYLERVMLEELTKATGHEPSIGREYWVEEELDLRPILKVA